MWLTCTNIDFNRMEILHSKIIGEGQPFLILHGYFGMGDNWKSLGNEFAKT